MNSIRLERIEGPACPECGCADAQILSEQTRWGRASTRRRCRHCGRVWTASTPVDRADTDPPSPGVVPYRPVQCPNCRSTRCPVTSSRRPIRWHKCADCQATFKSFEESNHR